MLFSGRQIFTKNGFVIRHKVPYFSSKSQYRWSLNVYGGAKEHRVIGPLFIIDYGSFILCWSHSQSCDGYDGIYFHCKWIQKELAIFEIGICPIRRGEPSLWATRLPDLTIFYEDMWTILFIIWQMVWNIRVWIFSFFQISKNVQYFFCWV